MCTVTHWSLRDLGEIFKMQFSILFCWFASSDLLMIINAFSRVPRDLGDDKSALVQVMAWCCQVTSHYLSQCWPIFMSPYGITRPQWVINSVPHTLGYRITVSTRLLKRRWIFLGDSLIWYTSLIKIFHIFDTLYSYRCDFALFDTIPCDTQ